ncbi:MAG TPA: hypothetical protein VE988_10455 [Gemmataceae bacterium]|nr:hypothetical protein [Gemmataceae bacterium]
MARRPTKPPSTSPNKVLVIFLVFFVLTNIGTAVWVYTAYKEKDKWDTAAKDKDKKLKENEQTLEWFKYQTHELMAAVGDPKFYDRPDAVKTWKENRASFAKEDKSKGAEGQEDSRFAPEKFKNEEGDQAFFDLLRKTIEPQLGGYKDGYAKKYRDIKAPLDDAINTLQKQLASEMKKNAELQQAFVALEKKQKDARDDILKQIQAGNSKIVDTRKETTDTMNKLILQNEDLRKQISDKDDINAKAVGELSLKITNLNAKLKFQEELSQSPNRFGGGDPHALVLDISTGKPLWDTPRAKIIRVDESGKKIYIDKGSKDGVKTGLTFTVFAAGANGRAAGELKATVEVIRVEDGQMSLCKVNTFYDADGREIAVTEATPSKLFREGGSALKAGDLLFNLCWGTHVAIVGIVDLTGAEVKSPAAQMDHLKEFMRHLEHKGMVIDAYTDLRDGKLVGEISNKTNYIIRGQNATKLKEGDDDARVKAINGIISAVRGQAQDRGLFIISGENFAVVTGYRRPGSADAVQTFTFTPARPASAPPSKTDPPK